MEMGLLTCVSTHLLILSDLSPSRDIGGLEFTPLSVFMIFAGNLPETLVFYWVLSDLRGMRGPLLHDFCSLRVLSVLWP